MRADGGSQEQVEIPGILHLDMDAFFASVEIRDDPSLRGLPVVVGGAGARGVVAAASYPARTRGIRSAMPMATARRLAPDLLIVPPRGDHYRMISAQVMTILNSVVADVEQLSIDEAFLDVRGARRLFGEPEQIAALLRRRIRDELGLPSSVGGSVSRAVAKIASAHAKPDGQLIVPAAGTAEFLAPLPVSAVSGIGPKAVAALEKIGVHRIGEIRDIPPNALARVLGPRAPEIRRLAEGSDRTGLGRQVRERSLGTERTWDEDLTDGDEVRRRITMMADDVARQLRQEGTVARTVVLKLRSPDGTTITRSSTLDQPTASGERLREHVVALWERERHRLRRIRLAGVRVTHLESSGTAPVQHELASRSTLWRDLETAMDQATSRFGAASLSRGSTLGPASDGAQRTEDPDGR
ncbi:MULTISPECIES: DNA polymerase IV [Brachybacterium]|uniref:DNA polymerase IV n=1 Tax=Brachybacterium TaxID=43668 RepID=UPI000DF351CA|nr:MULTISPECIES: DNA polymerase IV [Brachybacterium]RCS61612.1 DNA polymerase IV [Brachybacterium sp. JB7]RCS68910.1 DNA polymerase IV [Brachybacterium alimentarium]RCS76053.1 DNA polymerase IV [Brachybacterium alimentarium]RCS82970.1 DNA polymerase IV [Brachybacterium alimentarium]RCS85786.1 DNA polymerase IV [Brachybacterium alimentarium]